MEPTFPGIPIMLVALTLTQFAAMSGDRGSATQHLTVRVLDYVDLGADTRREMQTNAKRVLTRAGVAVEFIVCRTGGIETGGDACTGLLGPHDLVLRILQPRFAANGKQLGYAAMTSEGGACITVFMNPAQQKARVGNLSNGVLLGHAVAHEIGHLLLGANSHSTAGIMRPVWRPVDEEWMAKGVLLFDAAQGREMRLALVARLSR